MDMFTKKKRSEIMSNIRSKNTSIENVVFKALRKNGIYFQKHYDKLIGRPDIALPKKRKAVFIDGDFWHGYKFNKSKTRLPKTYWRSKIKNNIKRDISNRTKIRRLGWKILRVWEHEIKRDSDKCVDKIIAFLSGNT